MTSLKMKLVKTIGLSPLTPRWLKVLCLQVTCMEIASQFKQAMAKVDLTKITEEQRTEINRLIEQMNSARKGGAA